MHRPKLGITSRAVKDLKDQVRLPASDGVLIIGIAPGSSAAAAGLHATQQTEDGDITLGDIITSIDGEKVNSTDDLYRILDKHQIGDMVKVEIVRENGRTVVPVRLLEAPDTRRGGTRR